MKDGRGVLSKELFLKHCFGLPNRCSVYQAEVAVIKVAVDVSPSLFQGGEHSLVQQRGNTGAALANCALKVSQLTEFLTSSLIAELMEIANLKSSQQTAPLS